MRNRTPPREICRRKPFVALPPDRAAGAFQQPKHMLSVPHLVIIFLVALVVLGPDKLPEVARTMGKAMAELRRITGDFRYQVEGEMRELDRQARMREHPQPGVYQPPPVIGSPQQSVDGAPQLPQPPAEAPPPEFTGAPVPEPAAAAPRPAEPLAEPEPAAAAEPPAPEKPGEPHPA